MLLRNELQQYDFYRKALSLFMKHTPNIQIRCDMWTAILKNVLTCSENIFNLLDIFYYKSDKDNYLVNNGYALSDTAENFLDEIASIYGVSRQVVLTENYKYDEKGNIIVNTTPSVVQITLTNRELLVLIEATVRKYNFNGTRQGIREIYQGTALFDLNSYQGDNNYPIEIQNYIANNKSKSFLTALNIIYADNVESPASCTIIIERTEATANIMNLFTNGLLTIESVGIQYTYIDSAQFAWAKFTDQDGTQKTKFYAPTVTPYYIFADNAPTEG